MVAFKVELKTLKVFHDSPHYLEVILKEVELNVSVVYIITQELSNLFYQLNKCFLKA